MDDDYGWFDREREDKEFAQYMEESRAKDRAAAEATERRRRVMAAVWDPRSSGWESAPSSRARDEWIAELGAYHGFSVGLEDGRWAARVERKMPGYRDRVPFAADYPTLESLIAAVDSETIEADLAVDMALWEPPSHDLGDVAVQGGLPSLGKRSRGVRRR